MAADRDCPSALTNAQANISQTQIDYLQSKEQELTFKPKINKNYANAKPAASKKDQVCEQVLNERHRKEMQECTFKPKINYVNQATVSDKASSVRGTERFYELRDLKRRQD